MCKMINLCGVVARDSRVRMAAPIDLSVERGENIAIVGENGSGKNLLIDTLLGGYPLREGSVDYDFYPSQTNTIYNNVQFISFRDIYGSAEADYCYQLRWNVHEQEDIPTVADVLSGCNDNVRELLHKFGILSILDEPVVALSSGELRKLQIVKALCSAPRLLVLDNLFIGLDADARSLLVTLLASLAQSGVVQIILLLSSHKDIPQFINSVVPVADMRVGKKVTLEHYFSSVSENCSFNAGELCEKILSLPQQDSACSEVLAFNDIEVKYGARTILKNLSWRVESGQVWLLSGANGSGKSTLLSLVCADNLQSYACDITLFGRKRGSGESIWDIKKRIGYVSPEMHRSYLRNLPVKEIVASGLFDTIGLYRRPTDEQIAACRFWMELFGIENVAENSFLRVSSGEQRLALLARAFVKDPELLILDEPMHGLDDNNRLRVKTIIEAFSRRRGKSVVFVSHYSDDTPSTVTNRLELKRVE